MTSLLHLIGALADRHPSAVETIGAALAFIGVGFLVCPFWIRMDRRSGR